MKKKIEAQNARWDAQRAAIINQLRDDGRATLTRVARAARLPISTTFDRLHELEGAGRPIPRYAALLDFAALGYHARASVIVRVDKKDKESLGEWLLESPNANSVLQINNGWDYLADVVCKDIRRLEEWLDLLERKFSVKTLQVHYVIEALRCEGFRLPPL